jgi:hypothetical protein
MGFRRGFDSTDFAGAQEEKKNDTSLKFSYRRLDKEKELIDCRLA